MTTQSTDQSNENLAIVINRCKTLEAALTEKFGAVGRGLHEKTDSCLQVLPESAVKRLRFIAAVRNKTLHEVGFEPPIKDYIRACDAADRELANLHAPAAAPAIPGTSTAAAATPASATSARLPRVISYPLVLGTIFWLANAFLGQHEDVAPLALGPAATAPPAAAGPAATVPPAAAAAPPPVPPSYAGIIPFAIPASASQKDAYLKSAELVQWTKEPLWSVGGPASTKARFDWRTKQAAYDSSHARLVADLPSETLWVVDTSEAGLKRMKEIRKQDSRALQVDVLLGGTSGLRATLELPLTKPPRGNSEWTAYRYVGVLKFGVGQEVAIAGVQFFGLNGNGAPTHFQVREVFDCPKQDGNGCLGWTLNPKVTAVALSRRGVEYAIHTK